MPAGPRALPRTLAVLLTATAVAGSLLAAAPASADERRAAVPAASPAWASAAADRGAARASLRIDVQVAMRLPDEQAAEDFATAVSTPGDPQHRRPLSPADWIARFAPAQADVDAVVAAAAQEGLTVKTVPASRLFVLLTGTVDEVDAFFATRVHAFATAGETRLAPAAPVSLPRRVAGRVAAVTFGHALVTSRAVTPAKAPATTVRCSSTWRQHVIRIPKAYGATAAGTPGCGYTAQQLRALSGLDGAGPDGRGQTVAVIDAFGSPTMRADLARYSARNGLPAADYAEHVPARTDWDASSSCDPAGWAVEQSMDLQAVHAIAPRARLVYVGAADCGYGFDVAVSTVLDQGLASIVSNSWGSVGLDTLAAGPLGDDATLAELTVNLHQHVQAAGQGVGLYFASGDYGDDAGVLGQPAVDFPASSPWVTAVGGTTSGLGAKGAHLFSAPWGTSIAVAERGAWTTRLPGVFASGSGGGLSSLFTPPAYQRGVVPGWLSQGARALPDVAAVGAPQTGMSVLVTARGAVRTQVVGGTSLATPIVAAQAALAQQRAGRPLGFLNPRLYAAAAAGAVRDVAPSRVRRFVATTQQGATLLLTSDRDSSLQARRGWDAATGVGELTAASLRALAR